MPCSCKSVAAELALLLRELQHRSGEPKKRFDLVYARRARMPASRFKNIRQGRARRVTNEEAEAIRNLIASRDEARHAARGQDEIDKRIAALEREIKILRAEILNR